MSMLKYVAGAVPGKAIPKSTAVGSHADRQKRYEEKRERKLNEKWKVGRDWLVFEDGLMSCSLCKEYYGFNSRDNLNQRLKNLRGQNKFITGCSNRKVSAVVDHENSNSHKASVKALSPGPVPAESVAVKTLQQLKKADTEKMLILFKSIHAIVKNNRPLSDFEWLCELDVAKGYPIGETYRNQKAAVKFTEAIARAEREKTVSLLHKVNFFSFLMDGSTDISGDEQETIFVRYCLEGNVTERFLWIGSPASTSSVDLKNFVLETFDKNRIDKGKLVAMGSDGASNMVGVRAGLSTLLRKDINEELVNVHCFAHRLELAFRDVVKKNKLYDKLMTLLIGLHYFYTKQYKNKHGLLHTIETLNINGILPPKVTGTRWLGHLSRGIIALLRTFRAYEAHLCTLSHTNPKAEGLVKMMLDKHLVCFVLFLKEILDPLVRVSQKLQRPELNVGMTVEWVEAAVDLLESYKSRILEPVNEVIQSGQYQGIVLKGNTPTMSYKDSIIDGMRDALLKRFFLSDTQKAITASCRFLNLRNWQSTEGELQFPNFSYYGVEEVTATAQHFKQSLERAVPSFNLEDALGELELLKAILKKRHGDQLHSLTWKDVISRDKDFKLDFPMISVVIEALACIPPTSVSCETTFSQMKLIKTARRTRLGSLTLNNLLMVKLQSPGIAEFDPKPAVDQWLGMAIQRRRTTYKRKKGNIDNIQERVQDGTQGYEERDQGHEEETGQGHEEERDQDHEDRDQGHEERDQGHEEATGQGHEEERDQRHEEATGQGHEEERDEGQDGTQGHEEERGQEQDGTQGHEEERGQREDGTQGQETDQEEMDSDIEDVNIINDIYDNKDIEDDFCDDFQSIADNFMGIMMYSRE
ncbi:hypothetical protein ScPMuIL_003785 [Solemya velum]